MFNTEIISLLLIHLNAHYKLVITGAQYPIHTNLIYSNNRPYHIFCGNIQIHLLFQMVLEKIKGSASLKVKHQDNIYNLNVSYRKSISGSVN
jgi:hypothetical protein